MFSLTLLFSKYLFNIHYVPDTVGDSRDAVITKIAIVHMFLSCSFDLVYFFLFRFRFQKGVDFFFYIITIQWRAIENILTKGILRLLQFNNEEFKAPES